MFTHGYTLHLAERDKRNKGKQYQKNRSHDLYAIPKLMHLQKKEPYNRMTLANNQFLK